MMGLLQLLKIQLDDLDKLYKNDIFPPMLSNIDTSLRACLFIKHIVEDILDNEKLQDNKLELKMETFQMNDFYHDFQKLITPKLQEYSHLNFSIQNSIDIINTDFYRLQQLLLNIVGNALKFTDQGSIIVTSMCVYSPDPESYHARFMVQDTGRGIPNEKKKDIFQEFFQTNIEDSTRHGGYGLGLRLCKQIIDLMGGIIGFESEVGNGSVFWFEIPQDYEMVRNGAKHINTNVRPYFQMEYTSKQEDEPILSENYNDHIQLQEIKII
jgi:signal transduction histidine kinase